jgi:hypothetical protein
MEQGQMSKFCIDLEGMMLPDAIAAVVEAWYEAQNAELAQIKHEISDASVADLERRWGISRNALKARAKSLGIELQRKGPTLTVWPGDRIADGDRLDKHCKAGGALRTFKARTLGNLIPMADLAARWGITANTVSRRLSLLGIKPIRQGNFRFVTAEQLVLGDELQQHILSGKPMELFALERRYAAATD